VQLKLEPKAIGVTFEDLVYMAREAPDTNVTVTKILHELENGGNAYGVTRMIVACQRLAQAIITKDYSEVPALANEYELYSRVKWTDTTPGPSPTPTQKGGSHFSIRGDKGRRSVKESSKSVLDIKSTMDAVNNSDSFHWVEKYEVANKTVKKTQSMGEAGTQKFAPDSEGSEPKSQDEVLARHPSGEVISQAEIKSPKTVNPVKKKRGDKRVKRVATLPAGVDL